MGNHLTPGLGAWTLVGILGLGGAPVQARPQAEPEGVLYFFTTPLAEGSPEAARRAVSFIQKEAGRIRLRPVLLVGEWKTLGRLTEASPLTRTLRALEAGRKPGTLDLPLHDPEGLRSAERWDIRAVPAFVLCRKGRAHRTAGAHASLEDLLECER
ncbi:MAG TPA: hypothetical protein VEN81_13820 [Planctomycetota bacterium]|nr:hypothetical protein [Planctomycetota bacterium]